MTHTTFTDTTNRKLEGLGSKAYLSARYLLFHFLLGFLLAQHTPCPGMNDGDGEHDLMSASPLASPRRAQQRHPSPLRPRVAFPQGHQTWRDWSPRPRSPSPPGAGRDKQDRHTDEEEGQSADHQKTAKKVKVRPAKVKPTKHAKDDERAEDPGIVVSEPLPPRRSMDWARVRRERPMATFGPVRPTIPTVERRGDTSVAAAAPRSGDGVPGMPKREAKEAKSESEDDSEEDPEKALIRKARDKRGRKKKRRKKYCRSYADLEHQSSEDDYEDLPIYLGTTNDAMRDLGHLVLTWQCPRWLLVDANAQTESERFCPSCLRCPKCWGSSRGRCTLSHNVQRDLP